MFEKNLPFKYQLVLFCGAWVVFNKVVDTVERRADQREMTKEWNDFLDTLETVQN